MADMHETPINNSDREDYEAPSIEELDTSDGPALTAAGTITVIISCRTPPCIPQD